jgi:predicted transcriptional regulator
MYICGKVIIKSVIVMTTITLRYNPNNALAKSIIHSVKSAGVFQIEEEKSPYNKEFVEEIQESRRSKGTVIKTEDLWK